MDLVLIDGVCFGIIGFYKDDISDLMIHRVFYDDEMILEIESEEDRHVVMNMINDRTYIAHDVDRMDIIEDEIRSLKDWINQHA